MAVELQYSAEMRNFSRSALVSARAVQRPTFQTTIVNKISITTIFPMLLLLGNIGSAIGYALSGDWKRALYWAASSVCIGSITF